MKCLVVVAHPLKDSLCHHITAEVVQHLQVQGHNVTVKDLYQEKFDPLLNYAERTSYYQPVFDSQHLSGDIEQLKQAEMLVLVFPTWWFSFPAILKGWFDRVWAPGHAYHHASDLGAIEQGLTNLVKVNVITTMGSPWWVDRFVMWRPVRRVLKTAILGACAKKCRFNMNTLYKSEQLTPQQANAFIRKILRSI